MYCIALHWMALHCIVYCIRNSVVVRLAIPSLRKRVCVDDWIDSVGFIRHIQTSTNPTAGRDIRRHNCCCCYCWFLLLLLQLLLLLLLLIFCSSYRRFSYSQVDLIIVLVIALNTVTTGDVYWRSGLTFPLKVVDTNPIYHILFDRKSSFKRNRRV